MKLSRNVVFLGIVSLLTDLSTEIIYPLLPVFITSILGASTVFLGLIEGIAETTSSLFKLFSGWLSDKLNRRKPLVFLGYTISSLTRPMVALATMPWHILFARFLDRTGKGFRTSPRDALIAVSSKKNSLGKSFGFHRSMDHLGAVLGPLTAFLLLSFVTKDLRIVFWVACIPAALSVLMVIIGVKEVNSKNLTNSSKTFTYDDVKFNKNYKVFLIILFVFTLGNSSDAFLILKAKQTNFSVSMLPILWILLHIVKTLSSYPAGVLSDKIGRKRVIILGWFIYSLSYLGFAFACKELHIWMLFAIYGLYFGLTEGVEKAFVADIASSSSYVYGWYHFSIGIGAFPASLIMGVLWNTLGTQYAFLFGFSLSLLSTISLFLWVRPKRY